MEFALVGEPLVLDLVNTRPSSDAGPVDLLAASAGLSAWLAVQADRLAARGVPDAGAADPVVSTDLAAVHAVRDHAGRALDAARHARPPAPADIEALNIALRAAPAYRQLDVGPTGAAASTLHRDGPLGVQLAAVLAEATAELLTDPAITTVRACEAQDCTLLFLPAHPRRRWCSAARCGNRARVARYYQRHRAT